MKLFDDALPWYKANLHTHTTNSDGRRSPEETEALYREAGYHILALTDHRNISPGWEEPDFILLSGTELDTFYEEPPGKRECFHMIGLNLPAGETFNDLPRTVHPQKFIDRIGALGGVAILAHPQWSLNQPESILNLKGIVAAEVYNTVSGLPWSADRADSSAVLDLVADRGCYIPQVASDDAHHYNGDECKSFTMIQTGDFSTQGIMKALQNGAFYASRGPKFTQVEVTDTQVTVSCSECVTAIFYSNQPWVHERSKAAPGGATQFIYDIRPRDTFIRVELIDRDGNKAWLSPMSVTQKND